MEITMASFPKEHFSKFDNAAITESDKAHYMHAYHCFDEHRADGSLNVAAGEGAYIYDAEGNKYLDAVGGMWCTNIGLGRDEMADTIAEQVRNCAYSNPFADMANVTAIELSKKLAELAPGDLNHVFLTTGGSTAVDTAYRMIQYYQNSRGKHQKKHIISRVNAYHGSTYVSMSIGGKKSDHPEEFDYISDTIHHISSPGYYRAPEGMTEADFLESLVKEFEDKILELGADNVAAFFAEPIMGSGGVIVPPEGYHYRMWQICQKYDLLYVSDEVVTSFGRLGKFFASKDRFNIQPDIITTAKGLTSGYMPLGACILSDKIWDVIAEEGKGRCFVHGFTYSGHPVACAAALKNIEIIERENILSHVEEVGTYFMEQLKTLSDLPIVGEVRGSHFMACVEFVASQETKALFPEELNIGGIVHEHAQKRGLIVRPTVHLNIMSPSLILTHDQVDEIVSTLRLSIADTVEDLEKAGHM
ncbi:aminotransferase [Amphritea sp. 1_MG-2023]|uniref:aminotransferase n=1 Tax=Amphritea sp. 1_MG-2023 TaxID=3062670 RepID=UPI0026E2B001|nr:aminotransferase [Amphritea sp. 1_MG-2023]MDO6563392.1 aminotransferase [Amphritea sp. 1_MG-2023]